MAMVYNGAPDDVIIRDADSDPVEEASLFPIDDDFSDIGLAEISERTNLDGTTYVVKVERPITLFARDQESAGVVLAATLDSSVNPQGRAEVDFIYNQGTDDEVTATMLNATVSVIPEPFPRDEQPAGTRVILSSSSGVSAGTATVASTGGE